jgi:hypothetical protein
MSDATGRRGDRRERGVAMDLSKLPAAPFRVFPVDGATTPTWIVAAADDSWSLLTPSREMAEFICRARNALDVMTTLRWYSVPRDADGKEWIAMNAFGVPIERQPNGGTYFVSGNPFTCLVEARESRHE